MEKVDGVYRNNALSDTFNEIIAQAVVAYLEQRLQSDSGTRLRVLEIGAGTGGTSAIVLAHLRPFQQAMEEYCYTDLSQAFFFYAEENYVPDHPYICCKRLDIERAIEDQGFEPGSYDVVVAANVLHATKNIRQTLRNAKAALRTGGLLLLNEVSEKSLYAHLTFGLLDGWWRFEDADWRIPNCPGLWPSQWEQLLKEEGFRSIQFPAREAHDLGYQIIAAHSDGIIRQRREVSEIPSLPTAPVASKPRESKAGEKRQKAILEPGLLIPLEKHIRAGILESLSSALKINPGDIAADIAFSDYGIDSILGVKFIEGVNQKLSIKLNTAVIFEYPTLDRLSQYVMEAYRDQIENHIREQSGGVASVEPRKMSPAEAPQKRRIAGARRRPTPVHHRLEKKTETELPEIAVIGMSGMFPKAENIEEFWKNLVTGTDGVEELPAHYLDQKAFFSTKRQSGKTCCKWGGILKDRDCFDPLFFNLSPQEAESMNPHQRLILQEGWKAIEDAGYNAKLLSGSQTGIFIGAEPTGYRGESFTGYSDAIIASRLSYLLNLSGPAFVVNTGCSSSAVAIHLACESLRNRETDLALAGGVNACMGDRVQILLDEIGILSSSGRCRTFDSAADGTIISEAVAVVVLKRLADAVRDSDLIYGVISGSGINQDGASNGIIAPNGAAQEQLIARVYERFRINPEIISYVEAHGTGTKLGDPVEANALVRAFGKFTAKSGYCALGSAKSHIGHAAAAAGVTGLIKILLSLQHNQVPGLLHFNVLNPLIELGESPFYIRTEHAEWSSHQETPRMAALNSFGHSGTNAHLVIREYLETARKENTQDVGQRSGPVIVPLSAKTVEQLRQKAVDLLSFIRTAEAQPISRSEISDLVRIAYTLQTGREAMEERLGFIVGSTGELAEKLQSYINGEPSVQGACQGRAKRSQDAMSLLMAETDWQETIHKWIRNHELPKLLDLWVSGVELDWEKFYGDVKPRRLRLPVYPFAKEHYWTEYAAPAKHANQAGLNGSFEAVEDVIDKIDKGLMGEDEGVKILRELVG
jgi:3-oxoacyl-(acyl-carrier-protein) synthase/SAM-dependent methyltransferase